MDQVELFRRALQAMPVGLYVVDHNGRITVWSDGAERITGYLRQEMVGHTTRENLLNPCDGKGAQLKLDGSPLGHAPHNDRTDNALLYLKHKKGHRIPVRVHSLAVRDERGTVAGAVEVFHRRSTVGHTRDPFSSDDPALVLPSVIPNRMLTLGVLHDVLIGSNARNVGCGVLCIQVAHFGEFKTAHTEMASSHLVDAIADTVRQMLRHGDQVGRWSEDKLLAILPGCHVTSLETVASCVASIAHQCRIRWWGDELSASVFVGGVVAHNGESAESLSTRAIAVAEKCASRDVQDDAVLIDS